METYYNKRSIVNRMRRFVASYMGVTQTEQLDPSVMLLIEALAEEIYKLSGEIENIESRIVDKLAAMLTLRKSVSPSPAHAILHLSGHGKEEWVTKETGFVHYEYGRKKGYSFYPVCNTAIRQGGILFLVFGGCLYSVETNQEKTLRTRIRNAGHSHKNTIWIGLELNELVNDLKNLSFYFDFPTLSDKEEYLNLLPYTTWRLNDKILSMAQGLYDIPSVCEDDCINMFSKYDVCNMTDRNIKENYDRHYLTVQDSILLDDLRTAVPDSLREAYPDEKFNDFDRELIWIEIEYPRFFRPEILETLQVSINTVPVANKILRTQIVDVNNIMQIIPLEVNHDEYFISVQSITDSQGSTYYELPFNGTDCTYSLRRGGCERSDVRDARDYMLNLSDMLDTHASSISKTSDSEDDFTKVSKKISTVAGQLQKAVHTMNEQREIPFYVILEQLKGREILFLKYWLTNCHLSNHLKYGKNLYAETEDATAFLPALLLTSPIEGEKPPHAMDRKNLYQQVISSGSVIANEEDIVAFCKSEFHDSITRVEVRQGISVSDNPRESLLRTTDVYLTPHKKLMNVFQQDMGAYFLQKLAEHSPQNFNYRIFLQNNE